MGTGEIWTRFGSSSHRARVVASCAIVSDLRAQLKASAAARPQSPSPPSASSGYGPGAPQPRGEGHQLLLHVAHFIKTGGRETQTRVPICPRGIQFVLGGPTFSLGFQFVLHLRNIFLGLWALVTYIVFPPTPDTTAEILYQLSWLCKIQSLSRSLIPHPS